MAKTKSSARLLAQPLAVAAPPTESIAILVTPEMAASWRVQYHYAGQRAFRDWHCENLQQMMREGKFREKTQIAFARLGARLFCTNGQHTLAAIELSGCAQVLSIVITDCRTAEDVADDFARHDTHLTRQFGASLVAHAVHEELGLTKTQLNLVTAAAQFYSFASGEHGQKQAQQLTHDQKLVLVRRHGRLAATALSFFEGSLNFTYISRRTTLAPAMFCASANPDTARQFFREMVLDDGLRRGDPRKTLLAWLRSRCTPGGRSQTVNARDRKVAADHELVKGIAAAWNAWVENRDLSVIQVDFDAPVARFKNVGEMIVRAARKA